MYKSVCPVSKRVSLGLAGWEAGLLTLAVGRYHDFYLDLVDRQRTRCEEELSA